MKKILLCTLGPASFNQKTISRLDELGTALFRLNLSHTNIKELEEQICFIRKNSKVPICLDTEGAQIRTGILSLKNQSVFLKENETFIIGGKKDRRLSTFSLYPPQVLNELIEGDILSIDFDSALIQISSISSGRMIARVISSGYVGNNKAVNCLRPIELAAITEKDRKAIEIGMRLGIEHYALSFTNSAKDVRTLRSLIKGDSQIIAKIESRMGYENLSEILAEADEILIDRGDLSREIPIELIPFYQKKIIKKANQIKKPVYIATNLLESMTERPHPTRAEVNDVVNALMMGADGLVLASETAIGKRPIESATMIVKLISQFNLSRTKDITRYAQHITSTLPDPHGGQLVERWDKDPDWNKINKLMPLRVSDSIIMDAEQIAIGTFSPLQGFMTREEINSVLDNYRLPEKHVWTLPIVLQTNWEYVSSFKEGQTVVLVGKKDNERYATLKIKDIYRFPFKKLCYKWFDTLNPEHPGVQRLKRSGDCFLGGEITLLKRRNSYSRIYEFTPRELRYIFDKKGWSKIVGFHTRNAIHRGHEEIIKRAIESTFCDGLLISPVIGEKKKGDFCSKILLEAYQLMLDTGFFPKNRVFICALSTYSRYSGAREAVFTALCRKNFGCSHFIVGRDHTGVGNFYRSNASQELFKSIGDIGIIPLYFDEIKFCPFCASYVFSCCHKNAERFSISGTLVRRYLKKGTNPPTWLMRREISRMILEQMEQGKEIFI